MNHGRVTPAASRFNQVSHSGKKTFQLEQLAYFIFRRRGRRTDIILYSLFIIIFNQTTTPRYCRLLSLLYRGIHFVLLW